MNQTAFLLILISVFLHAGWNFLSKANRPSASFYVIVNGIVAVALLPFPLIAKIAWVQLPWKFWIFFAGSVFFEIIYAIGLFKAYKKNDISMAYPLMRALPVLLITAVTYILNIGKPLTVPGWIGIFIVSLGCIILPQKDVRDINPRNFLRSVSGAILLAAIGTTGYTLMDKLATAELTPLSQSGSSMTVMAYFCVVEIFIALGLLAYVFTLPREIVEFRKCWKTPYPYLCGIFSGAAYVLVLLAMAQVTNVSYLQAFRQMSLPLGVAAGIFLLHEKVTIPKLLGTVLVVTGLILTVF